MLSYSSDMNSSMNMNMNTSSQNYYNTTTNNCINIKYVTMQNGYYTAIRKAVVNELKYKQLEDQIRMKDSIVERLSVELDKQQQEVYICAYIYMNICR